MNDNLQNKIIEYLLNNGAADVGFSKVSDGPFEDSYAVSIVVKLSSAIISEITDKPTFTYFHHYRTVNSLIDSLSLNVGIMLEKYGYKYITVPASQSININGWNYDARYSHKKVACLSNLGEIGVNNLFLHREYGPCVRLGTVFTDYPFTIEQIKPGFDLCINCMKCVSACPSEAISGVKWSVGMDRSIVFNPKKCSEYMKRNFNNIGRGSVCGICIKTCYFENFINIKDMSLCKEVSEKILR